MLCSLTTIFNSTSISLTSSQVASTSALAENLAGEVGLGEEARCEGLREECARRYLTTLNQASRPCILDRAIIFYPFIVRLLYEGLFVPEGFVESTFSAMARPDQDLSSTAELLLDQQSRRC